MIAHIRKARIPSELPNHRQGIQDKFARFEALGICSRIRAIDHPEMVFFFGMQMHIFDPNLPLKDNYIAAYDIDYAAWDLAGHEHQEEFRDSGQNPARSAWLLSERISALKNALANGQLIALGIPSDDPALGIHVIPANLFLIGNSEIHTYAGSVIGLGREYREVHICRIGNAKVAHAIVLKSTGRPSQLKIILDAWEALKSENPAFLELGKAKQNFAIQDKAKSLFPVRFPGESRIGESTIRRHRRNHPELFV